MQEQHQYILLLKELRLSFQIKYLGLVVYLYQYLLPQGGCMMVFLLP